VMEALQPVDAQGISLTADAITLPVNAENVRGIACSMPAPTTQPTDVVDAVGFGGGAE